MPISIPSREQLRSATDGEAFPTTEVSFVFDDVTSVTLATALSALSKRERVSADNIANLETPGYIAKRVSFEDSLRAAVGAKDPSSATVTTLASTDAPGINGNNVSLDAEIVDDTKSQLLYQLLSTAVSAKFGLLSAVIKG
jgi:flagellar basal-body rod protein FlgB